jgi:hypothetical protein
MLSTTPFIRQHEQRSPVHAPKRASETAAVQIDRLQHLTAFSNAHATPVRNIPVPESAFCVQADAIGHAIDENGPNPPVR